MSGPIVCASTAERFTGSREDAIASGWRYTSDGWIAPATGWSRDPFRAPRISTDFTAHEGGIDFDGVTPRFGGLS